MRRRESYQQGAIYRVARSKGPDVWTIRYYEYDLSGKRRRRSEEFSDIKECPTEAHAMRKAEDIRQRINGNSTCVFFSDLIQRFEREELIMRPATAASYRSNLKRLGEKWGKSRLDWMTINTIEIERWLCSLKMAASPTLDLAHKTKHNVKALLHVMFERAMQWNYLTIGRNPIELIRLKGFARKKRRIPTISWEQFSTLIADEELEPHVMVMIVMAMYTGMRASEFLALRWEDIDFAANRIYIRRSFVGKNQGDTKTPESEGEVPMHPFVKGHLEIWKGMRHIIGGWVFGSALTERPFHADSLRKDHLQPACKRQGLPEIGWHSFRHSFRANMAAMDIPLDQQQEMMRHAQISTTLEYGKHSPQRFERAQKVVEMLPMAAGGR